MDEKKYASLNTIQALVSKLKSVFAPMAHAHKTSDIEDFQSSLNGLNLITTADIDEICDADIAMASEVMF